MIASIPGLYRSASQEGVVYNHGCTKCPKLCASAETVCLNGRGPTDANLMLVGEAPGKKEDEDEEVFIGKVGNFLTETMFPLAGINETEVRLTNAIRCRPPKNRTPTIREIQNCHSYLRAEVENVKPRVVVLMGNPPLASALGFAWKAKNEGTKVSGITKWRGKQIWNSYWNCWVIPTFHPSYVMRKYEGEGSDYYLNQAIDDLVLALRLSKESVRPEEPRHCPRYGLVETPERAGEIFAQAKQNGKYAFDIETGGHGRPDEKYPIGFSIATSSVKGFYFEWKWVVKHQGVMMKLMALLNDKSLLKIMHNGSYDLKILHFNGWHMYDKYFDTMDAAHLLDENFGKSLKDLAWIHTSWGGYDLILEAYKKANKITEDYSSIPLADLALYGAIDAATTYRLYEVFEPQLGKETIKPLFDKIQMPVRRVMNAAELNGMRVDIGAAETLDDRCEKAMNKLEQNVYEEAGREFNINSTKQLADVLYNVLEFRPLKETKTGYSVDSDSIDYVAAQAGGEIGKYLLDRAYLKTMRGTHISQALSLVWPDGRVHTSYNTTGTVTGRTSCSHPSLHNVPRDRLVRSLYIASEGCTFVEADLKSAEMAYLAAVSGEKTFLRAFEEGLDIHLETAKAIYGKDDISQDERSFAKCVSGDSLVYDSTGHYSRYFCVLPGHRLWSGKDMVGVVDKFSSTKKGLLIVSRRGLLCCSEDHMVQLDDGSLTKAKEIKKGDILQYAQAILPEPDQAETIGFNPFGKDQASGFFRCLNTDWAYFAGLFMGDGCCNDSAVSISCADDPTWKKSIRESCAMIGIDTAVRKNRIDLGSRVLRQFMNRLGLTAEKACSFGHKPHKVFKIPSWVLNVRENALSFIGGLIDSDGTVSKKGTTSVTTKYWTLAQDLCVILSYLGWDYGVEMCYNTLYDRYYYRIHLYALSIPLLCHANVLRHSTKRVNLAERLKLCSGRKCAVKNSVQGVLQLDDMKMYDIMVDSADHRYWLSNFITHNSTNFALVFGMSSFGLARRLGITQEEADEFIQTYFEKLPKVAEYMDRVCRFVRRHGYVVSLFHRYRRLPDGLSDIPYEYRRAERQARNSPIQSGACDYTYLGLVRLHRALEKNDMKAKVVHTVHDCVITDTPLPEVEKVQDMTKVAFEKPVKILPVKMKIDVEVHKQWGANNDSRLADILDGLKIVS